MSVSNNKMRICNAVEQIDNNREHHTASIQALQASVRNLTTMINNPIQKWNQSKTISNGNCHNTWGTNWWKAAK